MSEPIVTHADLPDLESLRDLAGAAPWRPVLDRLIAVAKADTPPLPEEDWVEAKHSGRSRVLWHKDGVGYLYSDCTGDSYVLEDNFDKVTPLRPTVTEAQLDEILVTLRGLGVLPRRGALVQALAAAGIEVQP